MAQRVFWTEGGDKSQGRWKDSESDDQAAATWEVALTAGEGTSFLAVVKLEDPTPATAVAEQ